MNSGKFSHDAVKRTAIEAAAPTACSAVVGHGVVDAAGGGLALGAVHRFDVPAGRFGFKKRASMLHKLLRHPQARKFLFKLHNALRQVGFLFLGLAGDLLHALDLIVQEGKPLSQDFRTLNSGESARDVFDRFEQ